MEAVKEKKTVAELCQEFGVAASQIYAWRKQLEDSGQSLFEDKRTKDNQQEIDKLDRVIGKITAEIKYECVYLHSFETVDEAREKLGEYINFYNQSRPHQSLNYHTPDEIYRLERIPTKHELFLNFALQHNIKPEEIFIPKYI